MWRIEQVEMSYEEWRATVAVGPEEEKFQVESHAVAYFQKLLKFAGKKGHQFRHIDAPELADYWLTNIQEKMEAKLEAAKQKKKSPAKRKDFFAGKTFPADTLFVLPEQ
jgi:hypothetical protein